MSNTYAYIRTDSDTDTDTHLVRPPGNCTSHHAVVTRKRRRRPAHELHCLMDAYVHEYEYVYAYLYGKCKNKRVYT